MKAEHIYFNQNICLQTPQRSIPTVSIFIKSMKLGVYCRKVGLRNLKHQVVTKNESLYDLMFIFYTFCHQMPNNQEWIYMDSVTSKNNTFIYTATKVLIQYYE